MAAFNEINGVPATADRELLTDILRGEMQFRGFVFSDYTADEELVADGQRRVVVGELVEERPHRRYALRAGLRRSKSVK